MAMACSPHGHQIPSIGSSAHLEDYDENNNFGSKQPSQSQDLKMRDTHHVTNGGQYSQNRDNNLPSYSYGGTCVDRPSHDIVPK